MQMQGVSKLITMNPIMEEDMKFILESRISWEKFKNKVVLISGAYGMLPSYLVFALLYCNRIFPNYNIRVLALVRNYEKAKTRFAELADDKNLSIILDDVNLPIHIEGPIDYIIHGASFASPQYYNINPVGTLLPNVIGTYNLLELAKNKNVKGFLFFSSGEVYGKVEGVSSISEMNFGYVDPLDIRNCYSESKRMGETMCKAWQHQFGVPTRMARIFHTYGPTMDIVHDNRVFSEFVSDIVSNRNIRMKSDGTPVRPFCYIADAVVAFLLILLDGKDGEAYNVCNSECLISIKSLAELLVTLVPQKGLKVIYKPREKDEVYMENKAPNEIAADITKLKSLGWCPAFSLKEGFSRTINSFEIKEE